ncbi:MAG TPA: hypothetical protein VL360_05290 [Gammaproteobacteria bacterium]|jgi:hypothetical protein|nr:hypothetical protein [Gammaproteobacteria bacterium]
MRFLNRIIPFLIAGMILVMLAFGMVLLAYIFLIGTVVGIALFAVSWIRERFFARTPKPPAQKQGRVIDSDDWRKL